MDQRPEEMEDAAQTSITAVLECGALLIETKQGLGPTGSKQ